MSGFEGAMTIQAQRGREIRATNQSIAELIRYIEENFRDPLLKLYIEVQNNSDGEYHLDDLESVSDACARIKTRLTNLANSFIPEGSST